ncbi:hypothetical protein [Kribbella sp. NPDC049227]|uniref:hypothetical protein n=1 Tax=Kribbella sp. NPDC049227 TaxID=3364113 RepID=UPI0037232028
MPRTGVRRSVVAALVTVALLVVPMACSDSSTEGTTNPSPTAAPATGEPTADCAALSALKSSLDTLGNVKPVQDGLNALTTAMAGVKTSLGAAAASASATLQPAVEGVRTAFSELETAASGLSADNLKQKAPAISTALRQVGTAASSLATTLTQSCPAG